MMETTRHILDVATARLSLVLFLRTLQATKVNQSTIIPRNRSNNHYVTATETSNAPKSRCIKALQMICCLPLRLLKEASSQPSYSHMQHRLVETLRRCQTR